MYVVKHIWHIRLHFFGQLQRFFIIALSGPIALGIDQHKPFFVAFQHFDQDAIRFLQPMSDI